MLLYTPNHTVKASITKTCNMTTLHGDRWNSDSSKQMLKSYHWKHYSFAHTLPLVITHRRPLSSRFYTSSGPQGYPWKALVSPQPLTTHIQGDLLILNAAGLAMLVWKANTVPAAVLSRTASWEPGSVSHQWKTARPSHPSAAGAWTVPVHWKHNTETQ